MQTYHTTKCSACSEEAARHCLGCYTVAYCSKECQKLDWPDHKNACNLDSETKLVNKCKGLFNRVELLQRIILTLRYALKDVPNAPTLGVVFLNHSTDNYLIEVICHDPTILESTKDKVRLIIPHPT